MGRTFYFLKRANNLKFQIGSFLLKIHVIFSPRGRRQPRSEPAQRQPEDAPTPKRRAEGCGQVPAAGGSPSSGITGVFFVTLVREWGRPAWPGRSPASEGIGERKESFFALVVGRCWSTLGHPGFAAGEVVARALLLLPHFKKGKIQKVERKGKDLKAWGLKPHSTSLVLPLNHGQRLWSLRK